MGVALFLFICYHIDGGKVVPLHTKEVCMGNGGTGLLVPSMDTR